MILSHDTLTVALVALLVDAAFGWPEALFRRLSHPVVWIGRLIAALDGRWNRAPVAPDLRPRAARVLRGAGAVAVVLAATVLPAWAVARLLGGLPGGAVLTGILAWPLVAARSLHEHVAAVAGPLMRGEILEARTAAGRIVGRDLDPDPAPIARAALESLAENASDGVVAPVLWAALGGLPGIAAYKAINTLDSMIGHRTPRHALFGRVAARLDDVMNLPASRLTGALLVLAAGSRRALAVMLRDAGRHRSPNAGWPEAAMAGALGVRLSGPRSYHGRLAPEPWLNAEAPDPGPAELARGLLLYRRAIGLLGLGLAVLVAL